MAACNPLALACHGQYPVPTLAIRSAVRIAVFAFVHSAILLLECRQYSQQGMQVDVDHPSRATVHEYT